IGTVIALLILLAVFGAVGASLLPLGLSLLAIVVALGAVGPLGLWVHFTFTITKLGSVIGLGRPHDLNLFLLSPLPGGRRVRPGETRRDRGRRRDGQPGGAVQRHDRGPGAARHADRAQQHVPQPRLRRHPGRDRGGGRGADPAPGPARAARRPDRTRPGLPAP